MAAGANPAMRPRALPASRTPRPKRMWMDTPPVNSQRTDAGVTSDSSQATASTSKSQTRSWLLRIAGTLVFVGLLVWLDIRGDLRLEDIFNTLKSANPLPVALSLLMY